VKKNNQWQKPDLSEMARSNKNMGTDRSGGELYGLGVPPAPTPGTSRELYGMGVPPRPTRISGKIYGEGVPPRPHAIP
jgi:hypothetical protein